MKFEDFCQSLVSVVARRTCNFVPSSNSHDGGGADADLGVHRTRGSHRLCSGAEEGSVPLGSVYFRDDSRTFGLGLEDRRRHLYIVGKTGMGKSTLLQNMIVADMRSGLGVCLVDAHGDLAEIAARSCSGAPHERRHLLRCRRPRVRDSVQPARVPRSVAHRSSHQRRRIRLQETARELGAAAGGHAPQRRVRDGRAAGNAAVGASTSRR